MVHGVESFAEVHGEYADCTAAPIIQMFTNMVLDRDECICTAAPFPVGKLGGAQVLLDDVLHVGPVNNFLERPGNDWRDVNASVVRVLYGNVDLG